MVTYSINPGVAGISAIMKQIEERFPSAKLEPFSQVSLYVTIDGLVALSLFEWCNDRNLAYTHIKSEGV